MSAQRYTHPQALAYMAQGLCPECGAKPEEHNGDPRFWMRPGGACDLLPHGVEDRINQFLADRNG